MISMVYRHMKICDYGEQTFESSQASFQAVYTNIHKKGI